MELQLVGVSATWAGNIITISGTPTASGTFNYSIQMTGGCGAVNATGTIAVTPLPIATFSYTGTPYCGNATNPSPTFAGGGVAGTFSSTAGLVFVSTATGEIDLAGSTAGTYTVTNTIAAAGGCGVITATSDITVYLTYGTWLGLVDIDWFNSDNWICKTIPTKFINVTIPNTAPFMPSIGAVLAECKSLTINLGSSLTLEGLNGLDIWGDWTNDGTFTPNSGTITFMGTTNQSINSSSNPELFHNLTIDKSTGGIVTCNENITLSASGILDFAGTNSYLSVVSGKTLTINNPSKITNYNKDNFVIVNSLIDVLKIENVLDTAFFPIGISTDFRDYAPFQVINKAGSTSFSVGVCAGINTSGNCGGIVPGAVNYTWDITSSSNDADVKLMWHASRSSIINANRTSIIHYELGVWNKLSNFAPQENEITIGPGFKSRSANQISFSPDGVKDDNASPLPITLTNFDVTKRGEDVLSNWSTASETNNDYFTLSRSIDAVNFEKITRVEGAGHSQTQLNYEYLDMNPPKEMLYYQLSQTDYNGKTEAFPMKSIDNREEYTDNLNFSILKNPTTNNEIRIRFTNTTITSENVLIVITDVLGLEYHLKTATGTDKSIVFSESNLPPGIYYITASRDSRLISKKLIIH